VDCAKDGDGHEQENTAPGNGVERIRNCELSLSDWELSSIRIGRVAKASKVFGDEDIYTLTVRASDWVRSGSCAASFLLRPYCPC
jgi:hypothetical protein